MKTTRLKIRYIIILFFLGFIVFVFYNELSLEKLAQDQLKKHGTIVSNALWNLDKKSPLRYLEEASLNHNYKKLVLRDDLQQEFIKIDGDTIINNKSFFTTFLPTKHLVSNVYYNNRKIGSLEVWWRNDSLFLYSNILLMSTFIILALSLYLKLLYTNTNLEQMVEERTFELKQVNDNLANHKEHLEEIVMERTKELLSTQQAAIDNAHRAGMADIANGVLHNIGNILNSVNTSAHIIHELSQDSFHQKFADANQILSENIDTINDFITHDSRAKALFEYYIELGKVHAHNQEMLHNHVVRLQDKIKATIDVIASQQAYAGSASMNELIDVKGVILDALSMENQSLENSSVNIVDNMDHHKTYADKTKLIHIVINLIKNAIDAMLESPKNRKILTFTTLFENDTFYLKIGDTGCGISQDNLNNIFAHGFTTKVDGHGFGLHSCANYMTEMSGKLYVESEGENKGATFTLAFHQKT
ncbi:MAG: sensor histidine kinase [Fibrobacterales bacterium]